MPARIEAEGWSLIATYTDHAFSGASRLRPGYQKLLEDVRGGAFDVVVAEALDRLSRDQEDTAALYKQLGFAGVRLLTLAEGEISELHVGLKGTMNALFLTDLAMKTRRAHLRRVIRLAGRLRESIEAGVDQHPLKPIVEDMARRARHLLPRHHQIALPLPLPTQRHPANPPSP